MPTNPLYTPTQGANPATAPSSSINDGVVRTYRARNNFDLSHHNYRTELYGKYNPFFVMDAVADDVITLKPSQNVRSLAMQSPLMENFKYNKDFFQVPMQAILPRTWELLFNNPVQGDDVPNTSGKRCLPIIDLHFQRMFENVLSLYKGHSLNDIQNGTIVQGGKAPNPKDTLAIIFTIETLYGSNSLLNNLGCFASPMFMLQEFSKNRLWTIDELLDRLYTVIFANGFTCKFETNGILVGEKVTLSVTTSDTVTEPYQLMPYEMKSFIYENFDRISDIQFPNSTTSLPPKLGFDNVKWNTEIDLNISRIIAYQLCCAQFYVNPSVDFVYSAELYRQAVQSCFSEYFKIVNEEAKTNYTIFETFPYNGIDVQYDVFSEPFLNTLSYQSSKFDSKTFVERFKLVYMLFGYRQTLKFGDYFTSAKTRPLGIGDVTINTSSGNVSAIDVSKSIVMQRFLNNVNKLKGDFSDYLRKIMGTLPPPDYHSPKFISHVESNLTGFETQNTTSQGQGNIVTSFNDSAQNYAFEIQVDMPSIIIGIGSIVCPRIYTLTKDRFFMHYDRFDMWNPELENIGDQPVFKAEVTPHQEFGRPFGYSVRNAEYKFALSRATGAFRTILRSWLFMADDQQSMSVSPLLADHLQPEYIRCLDFEFDRFFASLQYLDLGRRFHFVVDHYNECYAVRSMSVSPDIL